MSTSISNSMLSFHVPRGFPALITLTLHVLEQWVWCDCILLDFVIILSYLYKDLHYNAGYKNEFK